MAILEIADRSNKQHNASAKAELEKLRQDELLERERSFYKEFGAKWFEEVSDEIDQLIVQFNGATDEHSKLKRAVSDLKHDGIAIAFNRGTPTDKKNNPKCLLRRHDFDLQVTLEIESAKCSSIDHFKVLVKTERTKLSVRFSSFQVRAVSVTEKTLLGEGVEWKDRVTGDMNYEPTFYKRKIKNRQDLDAKSFADYALTFFVEKIL